MAKSIDILSISHFADSERLFIFAGGNLVDSFTTNPKEMKNIRNDSTMSVLNELIKSPQHRIAQHAFTDEIGRLLQHAREQTLGMILAINEAIG
jgi:hypothetical protein